MYVFLHRLEEKIIGSLPLFSVIAPALIRISGICPNKTHPRFILLTVSCILCLAGWPSHHRQDSFPSQCRRSRLCRGYLELLRLKQLPEKRVSPVACPYCVCLVFNIVLYKILYTGLLRSHSLCRVTQRSSPWGGVLRDDTKGGCVGN